MDICAANNLFAIDVLKEIGKSDVGQNIVFAPLSIMTALSMVYLGARGNTAAQMGKVLRFTDVKEIHSNCKNLLRELVENEDDYVLMNINKLFGEKTFQFLPKFLDNTKKFYGADLEQLDFLNDPETSRKYINDWIAKETQGKIQQLLPVHSISTDTALVLANTLYFAANWTKPFNPMKTYQAPFTRMSNEQVMVDMMRVTSYFKVKYLKNPGVKVLELPYDVSQDFVMVIVLPDNNTLLKRVEYALERIVKIKGLEMMNALVHLPKFKIEKSFSMKKILSPMGILDAFSQTKADFSGMTKQRDLFLSEFYHQTFLNIDEKGTEASSTTTSVMSSRSALFEEIKIDHPFYYFIKHTKSNCIMLCGIVHNP